MMSRLRVAAYVLRHASTWELLVFGQPGHPEAGTQIPAGGVQDREPREQAALREISAETGLEGLSVRGRCTPSTSHTR
jgi:8-oxo-dGTP pyrophosphatase MutT (NUDIX family)